MGSEEKMVFKMLKKDFIRNKVINSTILIFLVLSAFLMASGTLVVLQMANAMESLFDKAQPPHFLQMHSGEIDQTAIDDFTNSVPYVIAEETVEMLNIEATSIGYKKQNSQEEISMAGNMMDNGFVVQNTKFDYLMDEHNGIAKVGEGEIGVPISYKITYDLQIGDKVVIATGDFCKEMTIVCFVRDAQMASSLASSIRFLVSQADYDLLEAHLGNLEYIIEYRLNDEKLAGDIQRLYEAEESGMPTNGQAITYPLIKLLNSIGGGLLAGMMMLVSLLLIIIAVINLRFTLLATIEEEQREIGAMKAIGFSRKDIRNLYLSKYRILTIIGCIVGYLLALPISRFLISSISINFGKAEMSTLQSLIPLLTTIIVYIMVVLCCKKILKRIDCISVVEALVYGIAPKKRQKSKAKIMPLKKYKGQHMNLFLALRTCWIERKSWSLITGIFLLAICIMIIPFNILTTIDSPKFAASMGNSQCDIGIDLQFREAIEERSKALRGVLKEDDRVKNFEAFANVKYEIKGEEGYEPFLIECGDYADFPLVCLEGQSPVQSNELAISYLNAKRYGVKVGDSVTLKDGNEMMELKICGIYQEVTSGGYTAKAHLEYIGKEIQRYAFFINLKEPTLIKQVAGDYANQFSYAKVMPMEAYIRQVYGSITESFRGAVLITSIVGAFIACLITALFLKLQMLKESSKCATLKAIGFSSKEIRKQYMIEVGICAAIGIVLGIIVANTFGEIGTGAILSLTGMGIAQFNFVIHIPYTYVVCPIVLLGISLITTWFSQNTVKSANIIEMIKE